MRQGRWFAILLVATAACATRASTSPTPTDQLVGPTIGNSPGPSGGSLAEIHSRVIGDWTAPFAGEGLTQSSLEAAQSLITSFRLHDPNGLGEAQIFVSPDRSPMRRLGSLTSFPVTLMDGRAVSLTPGGQNVLLKQMIEEFCSRWTPGGQVLYIGDAGKDDPVFEQERLRELGVELDKHGIFPRAPVR